MSATVSDPWISHTLDPDEVQVLWQIKMGVQAFFRNKLEVAYLIAIDCVRVNPQRDELQITEKGKDTLRFFRKITP
jgi:hypothetical protein